MHCSRQNISSPNRFGVPARKSVCTAPWEVQSSDYQQWRPYRHLRGNCGLHSLCWMISLRSNHPAYLPKDISTDKKHNGTLNWIDIARGRGLALLTSFCNFAAEWRLFEGVTEPADCCRSFPKKCFSHDRNLTRFSMSKSSSSDIEVAESVLLLAIDFASNMNVEIS